MDDATDCARVDLRVTANAGDFFQVYIDNHLANLPGFCPITGCLIARMDTLSRGLHNLRIVYTSGTLPGGYEVNYYYDAPSRAGVDFGVADYILPIAHIGEEVRVDFTVR
jgi:hypothetical protein